MAQNNWNLPDFSALTAITRAIQEALRPVVEIAQRVQDTLRPIVEATAQYKEKIIATSVTFAKAVMAINAVEKMGEAQFVYWEVMDRDFVAALAETPNANKTLREFFVKEKFASTYLTVEKTKVHPLMKKHLRLYSQAISSFENGCNDISVNGLTSVFDGILSAVSGNSTHKLPVRVQAIKQKLEKEEILESDEHAMLTLAITLQKTMESFIQNAPFDQPEPKGLNRHWIAHGRSTRRKTKLDVVKMINLIYGLLLINDLDSGAAEKAEDCKTK